MPSSWAKTTVPWVIVVVASCAFIASYSELHRLRIRFGEVTHHTYHDHADVREFIIRAALEEAQSPVVVLGDSIVEMARFPEAICGHSIVNAGVSGADTLDTVHLARVLFRNRPPPYLVIVALGANDVGSKNLTQDYAALLTQLASVSPKAIAVAVTSDETVLSQERAAAAEHSLVLLETKVTGLLSDRVHFGATGYRQWLPPVMEAVTAAVCKSDTARH
jgi:hypothetical protein